MTQDAFDVIPASALLKRKTKMLEPGQPCRKCGTPVVRTEHMPGFKPSPKQKYYFEWWLHCRGCRENYMVESAKRFV